MKDREGRASLYAAGFEAFLESMASIGAAADMGQTRLEHHFECLRDWSLFHSVREVADWFEALRRDPPMVVEEIPLRQARGWTIDPETGDVSHESGEFFIVRAVRVGRSATREVGKGGWDQPILEQVGYDGGILGLLRQRFSGVPHYLIEAKAEPGNYGVVQMSPTLQATFSNLRRAHRGRKPLFAEYFEAPRVPEAIVLYDQWLSEDGGRLYLKRNKGMLVEVPEGTVGDLPPGFIWMSMYQIKEFLQRNAWVNPHVRGIIAHL
jgi:oxidase EvaA